MEHDFTQVVSGLIDVDLTSSSDTDTTAAADTATGKYRTVLVHCTYYVRCIYKRILIVGSYRVKLRLDK